MKSLILFTAMLFGVMSPAFAEWRVSKSNNVFDGNNGHASSPSVEVEAAVGTAFSSIIVSCWEKNDGIQLFIGFPAEPFSFALLDYGASVKLIFDGGEVEQVKVTYFGSGIVLPSRLITKVMQSSNLALRVYWADDTSADIRYSLAGSARAVTEAMEHCGVENKFAPGAKAKKEADILYRLAVNADSLNALKYVNRFIRKFPNDSRVVEILRMRSRLFMESGDYANARADLQWLVGKGEATSFDKSILSGLDG